MKEEKLSEVMGGIDEAFVLEAAGGDGGAAPQRKRRRFRPAAAAACLALLLALGSTAFAFASEAKEYSRAAAFFEANGISTEGLSREEVKAVYRDIETRRFAEDKTAEVLRKAVPGWEIAGETPDPEALAALWDENIREGSRSPGGIGYRKDERYVFDPKLGFDVFDRAILECRSDGELLWTAEFREFAVEDALHTPAGTAVWGWNPTRSPGEKTYGWLARVDDGGKVLWIRKLDHGFDLEYVAKVLDNGDGAWAVLSRGLPNTLCFSEYDLEGNERRFRKTEVGNLGIWNAARLGDGYIVQLGNGTTGDTALLVKVDREGNVTDRFSYEGEDCDYHLTDMIEFSGQVWLSAYAVPKQEDEGGRHEIANVLKTITAGKWDITDEELTPLLRENYTAVLLLCDPESGEARAFYTVKGALGGRLAADGAGRLTWDAERIVSSFFSPATSSFSIGAECRVLRCTFDGEGNLLGQEDTGEAVPYRR